MPLRKHPLDRVLTQSELREVEQICHECGLRHAAERRYAILRRYDVETAPSEIREAWPHLWGDSESGERRLLRDLAAIGRPGDGTRGGSRLVWGWRRGRRTYEKPRSVG